MWYVCLDCNLKYFKMDDDRYCPYCGSEEFDIIEGTSEVD